MTEDDDFPFVEEGTVAGLARENRRLHEENERLRAYNKIAHKEIDRMIVERSALKAKIEALTDRELRYFGEVPL
jgi:hypothetical protein